LSGTTYFTMQYIYLKTGIKKQRAQREKFEKGNTSEGSWREEDWLPKK